MIASRIAEINVQVLLIAAGLASTLLAGLLVDNWRRHRLPGLGLLAGGMVLATAGMVLVGLRGRIPGAGSMILGNLCFILACVCAGNGLRRLGGRPAEWLSAITLAVGAVMILSYFSFVHDAIEMRVIGMSALIALFCGLNTADALALGEAGDGPRRLLAASQAATTLLMIYRIHGAIFDPPVTHAMRGSLHSVAVLGGLVLFALLTAGVLWATARLARPLADAPEAAA